MKKLLAVLLLALPASAALTPEDARTVFERLKSHAGSWRGKSTKGWGDTNSVRVIAGGSVVMVTSFDAHPGETMATMYSLDGERLLLTHYCVAKNQPRLVATEYDGEQNAVTFEFLDGTGLRSRDDGHMDKFVLRFVDDNHYRGRWTWYANGAERWMEEIEYVRVTDR
jgi:hypothetical protein